MTAHLTIESLLALPAHRHLALALGCPANCMGLGIAVRNALQYVGTAARLSVDPAVGAWADSTKEMHQLLVSAGQVDTILLSSSPELRKARPYGAFLTPIASTLGPTVESLVKTQVGYALLRSACVAAAIPASLMSGFIRVLRAADGRSKAAKEWDRLAKDFPSTSEATSKWLRQGRDPTVIRFLSAVQELHKLPIQQPSDVMPRASSRAPGAEARRTLTDEQIEPTQTTGETDNNRSDPDDDDDDDDKEPSDSFVGWLVARPIRAGYRSRFGVAGQWDHQTVPELLHVCAGIRAALVGGDHRTTAYAYLAVVSLVTSLSGALAMHIPLGRTTDLFLQEDLRALGWCLLRVLDSERAKAMDVADVPEEQFVLIALPEDAAEVGAAFRKLHPTAASVVELLIGTTEEKAVRRFLEGYRKWLRSFGAGWLHAVYDARFARSFSQIYRDQAGDVIAAMLGFDFREVGIGTLHYVSLPCSFIDAQLTLAYDRIGWGRPAGVDRSVGAIGSQHAVPLKEFCERLSNLAAFGNETRKRMEAAPDPQSLLKHFRRLAHVRLLQTITLMAGRGTRLERLTWYALYGCAPYVMVSDKTIEEYSSERLVPVFHALRETLDGYIHDLDAFALAASRLGVQTLDERGRRSDNRRPGAVAFASVRLARSDDRWTVKRKLPKRNYLIALAKRFLGGPLNVGRHTILSAAVIQGVDPWEIKALAGHGRGHAEPFSDGGAVSPSRLLDLLRRGLGWMLQELGTDGKVVAVSGRYVLPLEALPAHTPSPTSSGLRPRNSRARVLGPVCDAHTITALRLIDHLSQLLVTGHGPEQAGARFLLSAMVLNWLPASDLEQCWNSDAIRTLKEGGAPVFAWRRKDCSAEIIRPLEAPSVIALLGASKQGSGHIRSAWREACASAAAWVRASAPGMDWPDSDDAVMAALDEFLQRWLRIELPPFVLAAASTQLAAATANRASVLRLAAAPRGPIGEDDVLVLGAPTPRGPRRASVPPSPLKQVIAQIHKFGRNDLRLGEEQKRWTDLREAAREIDCNGDHRAHALVEWIERETVLWLPRPGSVDPENERRDGWDPIQVSTASDYTRLFTEALNRVAPVETMRNWSEEWLDWTDDLVEATRAKSEEKRRKSVEDRLVAVRRLLRGLAQRGYQIPTSLLQASGDAQADGMRRAAASTLLLEATQSRIKALVARHFLQVPMMHELSKSFVGLRFSASLRSIEGHVFPLNAVSLFDDLVTTTDGWSHLKSTHARRLQPLPRADAAQFRATAALVAATDEDARWIFLFADEEDWSAVGELAQAYAAAIRQETGEADARPHAGRAVAPLRTLLPGWESMLRALINGVATVEQCFSYCKSIQSAGVSHLVLVIHRTGHGHPLTYLTYYFPLWPLLMSLFARASLARFKGPAPLLAQGVPAAPAALRKAQERARKASKELDPWAWSIAYAASKLSLKPLALEGAKSKSRAEFSFRSPERTPPLPMQVVYLALRLTGLDPIPATHACSLDTASAAAIENLVDGVDTKALRRRVRQVPDGGGRDRAAEIRNLQSDEAAVLAERLVASSTVELQKLEEALTIGRGPRTALIPVGALIEQLRSLAAMLPPSYALLVQVGRNRYDSEALARLGQLAPRIRLGKSDGNLGNRPRVSVIDAKDPENDVSRARLTSNVRCVIAAIQLIRCR